MNTLSNKREQFTQHQETLLAVCFLVQVNYLSAAKIETAGRL